MKALPSFLIIQFVSNFGSRSVFKERLSKVDRIVNDNALQNILKALKNVSKCVNRWLRKN